MSQPSSEINSETFIAKYKPYYLNDFTMNDKRMRLLRTLFEIDDLNVLFVGAPGCGKTTLLYAILREYYGLSKTANIPETNVLFINNLKEQGINYFRNEMKTFCQSKCSIHGKKKMIVIDDIDTVNEQSQQVFRNYIDKYSNNMHFVSVCTNIQKVIESIQSRVHIMQMQSPNQQEIENIMQYIVEREGIQIDDDAKSYVLETCNNSLRVLINTLEKFYIYGQPITVEVCRKMCSNISTQQFDDYMNHLKNGRLVEAIETLFAIHDFGYSVIDILDYFFTYVKATPLLTEEEKYKLVPYLCKYITIFNKVHEDGIELAVFTNEISKHLGNNP